MKNLIFLLLSLATTLGVTAQVKIFDSGSSPEAHISAGLDVDFNNRGVLPPRMTTPQRAAIANPSPGLFVFNTDINCMEFFNGAVWKTLCGAQAVCSAPPLAPNLIGATDYTTSQFRVLWNFSDGALSYLLQASLQSDFSSYVFNQNAGGASFGDIQGLSPGDVCYFRVYALNACGISLPSSTGSATVPD